MVTKRIAKGIYMLKTKEYTLKLSFCDIYISLISIGDDLLVTIYGGDKPHIGCSILTIPYISKDNTIKCTSSILNITSHKDHILGQVVSDYLSKKYNKIINCTCGIHIDNITTNQIEELSSTIKKFLSHI